MKHPEHICRFNDGDCTCECYDSGYDDALTAERERLVSLIENTGMRKSNEAEIIASAVLPSIKRQIINLINPPSKE